MNNNLNELNSILFDTLRDLRGHKIDEDEAAAVSKLGSTIVSNAKVQLQAVKMMNGGALETDFFGEISNKKESVSAKKLNLENKESIKQRSSKSTQLYDLKLKFAGDLGFKNISDAIAKHGNIGFTTLFDEWLKENSND